MNDNVIINSLDNLHNREWIFAEIDGEFIRVGDIVDFVNRQKEEIKRLEYVLLGVMHSVDKWLDDKELEQDEVNRAITMREKTLQIVETAKAEAIKDFAERLEEKCYDHLPFSISVHPDDIDNLVKEMVGDAE